MSSNNNWEKVALGYKKKFITLAWFAGLLAILGLACFYWYSGHTLEKQITKFPYLDPTRNLLEKKDAITNIQPLREKLDAIALREASSTKMSIYFEFLNTGANIVVNKDEKIWPVSLAKLPLAMIAVQKMQNGEWRPDQNFEILDENLNGGSGEVYRQGNGQLELWRLITEMLINSDNTAYRVLKRNISLPEREQFAEEVGLGQIFEEEGKVSAKEFARLFRALFTASYLDQENSQNLLKLLSRNNFKEFLSTGIPSEVEFAHKQGENVKLNVYSDVGIVYYDHRPYILSVMLEPTIQKDVAGKEYAKRLMNEISKEAFEYIKNK